MRRSGARLEPAVVAVVPVWVLVAALTAACTSDNGSAPAQDATPTPTQPASSTATPLSAFDSSGVSVARADFCGLVPASAAETALGAPVAKTSDYGNGQRATLTAGVRDVAHEYSCSWTAADGSTARAWVFAPRITRRQARGLVRDLGQVKGCTMADGAPAFGRPSLGTLCVDGRRAYATYRGLFVDAWLSCSVSAPKAERRTLLDRAGSWCVAVAHAVDTSTDDSPG